MCIINFNNYISKRGKQEMCRNIAREIHEARKRGRKYNRDDMKPLAERFLKSIGYNGDSYVPIIKIVKETGFEVLWGSMKDREMSGFVSVDKDTIEKYETDKIIGVNGDDELGHQRFVIAHEFAHYLFDYDMTDKPYFDRYIKNSHKPEKEQIANTFAANILMPAKYFVLQYDEYKSMDGNIKDWTRHFDVQKKAVEKRVLEVISSGI